MTEIINNIDNINNEEVKKKRGRPKIYDVKPVYKYVYTDREKELKKKKYIEKCGRDMEQYLMNKLEEALNNIEMHKFKISKDIVKRIVNNF
jgi:hypothetical protein